jgi:hypothetical protein
MLDKRNKNADKTLIDWDLNIYMPEEWDEEKDDSYYDPASWKIHVYAMATSDTGGVNHEEWDDPIVLTAEEIRSLGFNRDDYFKDEVDTWYGLDSFRNDYWSKLSDRLKEYFDRLPKYWEDLKSGNYGDRLTN